MGDEKPGQSHRSYFLRLAAFCVNVDDAKKDAGIISGVS